MLRSIRAILHGPLPEKWAAVTDAPHIWRKLPFAILLAALLIFGCFPKLLTDKIGPSAEGVLGPVVAKQAAANPAAAKASSSQQAALISAIRN